MDTFTSVIDTLGGSAVVARGIKANPGTIRQQRLRDSVPPEYWPRLVAFAVEQGRDDVTLAKLAELAARPKALTPSEPAQPQEAA